MAHLSKSLAPAVKINLDRPTVLNLINSVKLSRPDGSILNDIDQLSGLVLKLKEMCCICDTSFQVRKCTTRKELYYFST